MNSHAGFAVHLKSIYRGKKHVKGKLRNLTKELKDRGTTSVTSHMLSRHLTSSGNALLCENLPATTEQHFCLAVIP